MKCAAADLQILQWDGMISWQLDTTRNQPVHQLSSMHPQVCVMVPLNPAGREISRQGALIV